MSRKPIKQFFLFPLLILIFASLSYAYTMVDYEDFNTDASATDLYGIYGLYNSSCTGCNALDGCEALAGELNCAKFNNAAQVSKPFNLVDHSYCLQSGINNGNPRNFSVFYRIRKNPYFEGWDKGTCGGNSNVFSIMDTSFNLWISWNCTTGGYVHTEVVGMINNGDGHYYAFNTTAATGDQYDIQIDYIMANFSGAAPRSYLQQMYVYVNGIPGTINPNITNAMGTPLRYSCFNRTNMQMRDEGWSMDTMAIWVYDPGEAFTNANNTPEDVYTIGRNHMPSWDYSLTNRFDQATSTVGISSQSCTANPPDYTGSLPLSCYPLLMNYANVADADGDGIYQALGCSGVSAIYTDDMESALNDTLYRYFLEGCNSTYGYYTASKKGLYFPYGEPADCAFLSRFSSDSNNGNLLDNGKSYLYYLDFGFGTSDTVSFNLIDYNNNIPLSMQVQYINATGHLSVYYNYVLAYDVAAGFDRSEAIHLSMAINKNGPAISYMLWQDSGAEFASETYGFSWTSPIEVMYFQGMAYDMLSYQHTGEYIGSIALLSMPSFPDYYTYDPAVEYACISKDAGNFIGAQFFTDDLHTANYAKNQLFGWVASAIPNSGNGTNPNLYENDTAKEVWDDVFQGSGTLKSIFVLIFIVIVTLACVYIGHGTIYSFIAAVFADIACLFVFSTMGLVAQWIIWIICIFAALGIVYVIMKVLPTGGGDGGG